jgi:hypothetical protein
MLLFQFAMYLTRSEPQRSAEVATRFLQRGDIGRTLSIIDVLRQTEPAMADDLYVQTLSRVKRTGTTSRENISLLASYVFPGFGEGVLRTNSPRPGPSEGNAVSPALRGQFLDFAIVAVMKWIDVRTAQAQRRRDDLRRVVILLSQGCCALLMAPPKIGWRSRGSAARGAESSVKERRRRQHG